MLWRELWDGDTVLVKLRQCFSQEVTDRLARMVWSSRYGSTLVDVSCTCLQVIFSRYSLNTPSSRQIAQACLHLSSGGVRGAWVTLTAGSDGFFFYPGHTILSRHASSLTSLPTIGIHAVTLQEEWERRRSLIYDCRDDFQKPRLPLIPSHLALPPVVVKSYAPIGDRTFCHRWKVGEKERGQQRPINLFYCTKEKSS